MRKPIVKAGLAILLVLAAVAAWRIHHARAHRMQTYPAALPRQTQAATNVPAAVPPSAPTLLAAAPEPDAATLLFADPIVRQHASEIRALAPGLANATPAQLTAWVSTQVTVRLDFYRANEPPLTDNVFFGPGSERTNAWRWADILLVDALPGPTHTNAGRCRFQIRAQVTGPTPLLQVATTFPVRVYRSFMSEPDDGEPEFANAYRQLFGAAETNTDGVVLEPEGETLILDRLPDSGDGVVRFVSGVLDLNRHPSLNPAIGRQPASFAAFDADALFTQYREVPGDEEPDGWAFCRAMTAAGFVSAGLALPGSDAFKAYGTTSYQFALGLDDPAVLDYPPFSQYDKPPESTRAKLRTLPAALQPGGTLHGLLKNLGASKILGRPAADGAFIVSTGVQKLVITARRRVHSGDRSWRLPGLMQVLDGTMDQCLVRAPAPVFLFSGHGWDMKNHWQEGEHLQILNSFTGRNPSVFRRRDYLVYIVADQPARRWAGFAGNALPENRIVLADKWRPDEVRLQWVFFLGCYVLDNDGAPFTDGGNAGIFGRLLIDRLGAKGVIGFAEHGFTSVSFLSRFVERARHQAVPAAWMSLWNDDEARAYQWYEQNEEYGRSNRKTYATDLINVMPAYLVRQANAEEALTPENTAKPSGGTALRYGLQVGGSNQEVAGAFRGRN